MIDNEKYVVFKKEAFEQRFRGEEWWQEIALPDAVVIRFQDVLAAPALEVYAMAAQTFIDSRDLLGSDGHSPEERKRLEHVRDLFMFFAIQARQHPNRKIPD